MNARRLMVLLIAVLALAAAGCGGGGSDEASGDTDTVVTEETTSTDDMTTTEDTTTETTSDDADVGALTGKCAELAGLSTKLAESLGGQSGDIQSVATLFDEIADQVPDEIKADYQVLADYISKMAEALKGVDLSSTEPPSAEVLAKLQQLTTSVDTQEVQQATAHIEAWARDNC